VTTAPQLSPDGQWWWDGYRWVPAHGYVPWQGGYGGPPAPATNDGLAIASLVCSLVWVGGLGSIAGIVLGHLSRSRAQREGRAPSGMSLAGIIAGYVGAAVTLFFVVIPLVLGLAFFATISEKDFTDTFATQGGAVEQSLNDAADAQEDYWAEHHAYASSVEDLSAQGFEAEPDVTVRVVWVDGEHYCLQATSPDEDVLYLAGPERNITTQPCYRPRPLALSAPRG
jgi:hypothetical protein